MLRCAILDDYQRVALSMADWTRLAGRVDVTVFHEHFGSEDELVDALQPFAIVVAMRERTAFPAAVLERLPHLRLLVTTGMRNAAIDVEAARRRGIVVAGTRGRSEHTVELTWALILAWARHIVRENEAFRTGGPWQQTVGVDLHGKRLGIVGLGRIGSRVARVGLAFGMDVVAWSPHLTPERAAEAGVRPVAKDELFATSDFVTIHLVLGPTTRGLVGAADLRRMRPTAFLVNTSRGPIVDSAALVRALREGWIAGAGLDVYDVEPLPRDHVLRTLPNVLGTPHLGYVTEATYRQFYGDVVEDIEAFLEGRPIRLVPAD
ncbi:MAG: D-2-hydroxyacid dehydrogenase family protein [Actinomycetia bacterium]|nr:D-2-hydroxyacid dehydrogenase family protein [Actinomycetes bacterium]